MGLARSETNGFKIAKFKIETRGLEALWQPDIFVPTVFVARLRSRILRLFHSNTAINKTRLFSTKEKLPPLKPDEDFYLHAPGGMYSPVCPPVNIASPASEKKHQYDPTDTQTDTEQQTHADDSGNICFFFVTTVQELWQDVPRGNELAPCELRNYWKKQSKQQNKGRKRDKKTPTSP